MNAPSLSFWELDTYFRGVDYVVVGSGLVGLNAAVELKRKFPRSRVLVLEKGFLPAGASSKNAGFGCFGSPTELLDDLERISADELFALVEKRWQGLQRLRSMLGDANIDFLNQGGHELFTAADEEQFERCADQLDWLNQELASIIGPDTFSAAPNLIPQFGFQGVKHLIRCRYEGQIDTGKMVQSLLAFARQEGVEILNGITVNSVTEESSHAQVNIEGNIELKCQSVIVATNGFARKLLPDLDVKPARAQVLITKPIKNLAVRGTFHYEQGYYYFRDIGNRLLFGGGRNLDPEGETTTALKTSTQIQSQLETLLQEVILPNQEFEIEHRWAGVMGVGAVKSPIVTRMSSRIICAVRLGGMGVALGSLVGAEAAELVEG